MITMYVGVALLALSGAGLMSQYTPVVNHLSLYLVLASPLLVSAAPIAMVVLMFGRLWALAGLAICLTAVLTLIHVSRRISVDHEPESIAIRVMTVNMQYGRADPTSLTALANAAADVVMIQELNPQAVQALTIAGLDDRFPHHVLDPRPGAAGVGVYSRYPITDSSRVGGYRLALVRAELRVPLVVQNVSVLSVHLDAPWPRQINGWRSDIAKFPYTLSDVAARAAKGAVIVAGDFNATIGMRPFRKLLTNGYRDAAKQVGAGRSFTFPANRRFPAVLGIDHIIIRNAVALTTSTVEIPATDHRVLLATVMLPTR